MSGGDPRSRAEKLKEGKVSLMCVTKLVIDHCGAYMLN